jgi:hypothetical protein
VQRYFALGRTVPVLEQKNALPGAEHRAAVLDWD